MPSGAYRRALRSVDPADAVLDALVLTHPAAPAPVRLVDDGADHVIDGETYLGLRMRVLWPDQSDARLPRARVAVDNVGRELTEWVEATRGLAGGRVTCQRVLGGTVEAEITLDVGGAVVDAQIVQVELGFGLDLGAAAVAMRYTPATAPGLF